MGAERVRRTFALGVAGLLLSAAPAAASTGTIALHADGHVDDIRLDDASQSLPWDVVDEQYYDGAIDVADVSGWSVRSVITSARSAISQVRAVRVVGHGSNTSFALTGDQLADPPPFRDNLPA